MPCKGIPTPSRLQQELSSSFLTFIVKSYGATALKDRPTSRKVKTLPPDHHNLMKVGSRYSILVVFSAPLKLSQICLSVKAKTEGGWGGGGGLSKGKCTINHSLLYTENACPMVSLSSSRLLHIFATRGAKTPYRKADDACPLSATTVHCS